MNHFPETIAPTHYWLWASRFKQLKLKGLWGVYLHSALRTLATNLIGIFIPLYIYQITKNIYPVFLFFAVRGLFAVLLTFPAGHFIKKFGLDTSSILGSFLRILFLLLLILSAQHPQLIYLSAFVWGIMSPFYWLPYHYTVVRGDDGDGRYGKEVSTLSIFQKLAAALSPFLGGLIIFFWDFSSLYIISILLILISIVPLLLDRFNKKGMRFNNASVLKTLFHSPQYTRFRFGFLGYAIEASVYSIVRPLIVFIAIGTVVGLGSIETAAHLLSLFALWWVGKHIDRRGPHIMRWGILISVFLLPLFAFLKSPFSLFLLTTAYLLIAILVWVPFGSLTYQFAARTRRLEFLAAREIWVHSAIIIINLIFAFLFYLSAPILIIFLLGSFGLALCLMLLKEAKSQ